MGESDWPPAVRRSVEALGRGDLEGFLELWSDDVVWRIGGNNQLTGIYRGKQAVREVTLRTIELSQGAYQLEPMDVLADEKHLVLMFHATGQHADRSIDTTVATFVTVDDEGKWEASWWLPSDQAQYDAFWS
jgi:ketosteroid isomerase-like protein